MSPALPALPTSGKVVPFEQHRHLTPLVLLGAIVHGSQGAPRWGKRVRGLSSTCQAENAHGRCGHDAAQDSKLCKEKWCATVTHYL